MRISMATIWVENPRSLRDWYTDHLGMRVIQETPRFVQLGWDERDCLLAFHVGTPLENPERVQLHIRVDDVDATYRALSAKGLEFDEPPTNKPWGLRTATLKDPAGHGLEFEVPLGKR